MCASSIHTGIIATEEEEALVVVGVAIALLLDLLLDQYCSGRLMEHALKKMELNGACCVLGRWVLILDLARFWILDLRGMAVFVRGCESVTIEIKCRTVTPVLPVAVVVVQPSYST